MSKNTEIWYRKLFPTSHKLLLNKKISEVALQITGKVVVIGAGYGNYKFLFKNAEQVICSDISVIPGIDFITDAHSLPFLDNSIDTIVAFEVFEHFINI